MIHEIKQVIVFQIYYLPFNDSNLLLLKLCSSQALILPTKICKLPKRLMEVQV